MVESGIARRIKVVGHPALTVERAVHQFFPVGQQTKRLTYPRVVERWLVQVHVE